MEPRELQAHSEMTATESRLANSYPALQMTLISLIVALV